MTFKYCRVDIERHFTSLHPNDTPFANTDKKDCSFDQYSFQIYTYLDTLYKLANGK